MQMSLLMEVKLYFKNYNLFFILNCLFFYYSFNNLIKNIKVKNLNFNNQFKILFILI